MYTNENFSGISGYVCKYDWESDTSYRDSWDEWRESIRQEDEDRWIDNHWDIINDDNDPFNYDERRRDRILEDEEDSFYHRNDDDYKDPYWDNNDNNPYHDTDDDNE